MPAYRDALDKLTDLRTLARFDVEGPRTISVTLLEGKLPGSSVPLWLVDSPEHFDRRGNPYLAPDGRDWPDNDERFTLFCRVIEQIAVGKAGLGWLPDLVHCNDWQTGLAPALLSLHDPRPATVFTIHNLAYQGLFPGEAFMELGLPESLWTLHGLEFWGQLSFIKGGIAFADRVNTVSPQYAREICTPEFGYGLDPLLQSLGDRLCGILNGVNYSEWNPAKDTFIPKNYNAHTFDQKLLNKLALQRQMKLPVDDRVPLIGLISRLVEQKGIDLLLTAFPALLEENVQFAILGSGHGLLEEGLQHVMEHHDEKVSVKIGYDEELAHMIEAGADMFLMPSRYEPCGLNQIYSLRYGTLPIVRHTGGLANTVIDASDENIANTTATGFVFHNTTPQALHTACKRAIDLYTRQPKAWKKAAYTAMQQDFSWRRSARLYLDLYQQAGQQLKINA